MNENRDWASFSPFDPELGLVIREPLSQEPGYWTGAPGIYYDIASASYYLIMRWRRPRGVMPDRGAEIHLARSWDGLHFDTIWKAERTEIDSPSIERCAILRLPDKKWGLLVSYVDPQDNRWRIDLVSGSQPDQWDLRKREPVFQPGNLGLAGVKDPYVFRFANRYHMLVSIATPVGEEDDELHASQDAYNTGRVRSATGLAVSADGYNWDWKGEVFGPSESGWDSYCARISCLWRQEGVWLGLYDGAARVEENYEERVGLVYSVDLQTFHRVTTEAPLMTTPRQTGALRYFDRITVGNRELLYYEMARADESHELRVISRPWRGG